MDHDVLKREFDELKRRVMPMLEEYEGHIRRNEAMAGRPAPVVDAVRDERRVQAHAALNEGDVVKAGEALGLEKAHGGDEPDDSYERRIRAELYGASAAEATGPRLAEEASAEGGGQD